MNTHFRCIAARAAGEVMERNWGSGRTWLFVSGLYAIFEKSYIAIRERLSTRLKR